MASIMWIGTDGNAATAGNYSGGSVPTTGDHLFFPAGGGSVTSGLSTLTGVVLGNVFVQEGYAGTIGVISSVALTYFKFQCARLEVRGTGTYALDIESSAISPIVLGTTNPSAGLYGCYIKGSAIATLDCIGGSTIAAGGVGDTATIATLRVGASATAACGSGVSLTTCVTSGKTLLMCALTTLTQNGGTCTTEGVGAITTVNARGGTSFLNSAGTITTLALDGGHANFLLSQVARTVTNWSVELPSKLSADTNYVTFTNNAPPITGAFTMDMQKA